jgi:hypothetical protein
MGELTELQNWMASLLVRRRDLSKDAGVTRAAGAHATGNERLLPVEQLEIYREQYWLRHTASLVEDFPGLGGILGQEAWERLVEEYLVACPPETYTLRDLGQRLPAFMEACEWLEHRELCRDMARLEWVYIEAFDAPDAMPLDAGKLAAIPEAAWETARIVLDPAVRLLTVGYPVAELRRRLRSSEAPVPIPERAAENLVIYRSERDLFWERVSDCPFAILEGLCDGLGLAAACGRAAERFRERTSEIEAHVGEWFQDWGQRGWVVDVVVR